MLLSAMIAMGIHACLLWADFGRLEKIPLLKPKTKIVTLTLDSRPAPKSEPPPKLSKPAAREPSEAAPQPTPKPEPGPETKTATEHKPEPEPQPKPAPMHRPEIRAASPPLPEIQIPDRPAPETKPASGPRARSTPVTEKPVAPESVSQPESRPLTGLQADGPKRTGSAEPAPSIKAFSAPAVVREAKPRYRDNPPPRYPILARKRGYQGIVTLDVFIDKNGRVANIKLFSSSGYAILDKAARNTVEDWLFEPGMQGDEKIEMWVKVPIRFELK